MKQTDGRDEIFSRLIGLGERSIKKSYFPQLQKKIEELEKSEKKYRLLADNISDVIWVLDMDLCYTFVSASIERMTGYKPEELAGKPFADLLSSDSARLFSARMQAFTHSDVAQQKFSQAIELQFCHKDGSSHWIEIAVSLSQDISDRGLSILGISRDITVRKNTEAEKQHIQEQLLQAQKMESIGTLTGGIAHDFNNVLTIINGYSEKLLRTIPAEHPYHHDILAIHQAGKKAEALTRQLLGFSRKQPYKPEIVDINRTIGDLNTLLRRLIGEDISVNTRLARPIDPIEADNSQLEQILTNLVINARDALKGPRRTDSPKTIIIETGQTEFNDASAVKKGLKQAGKYVFFSISDNGSGIPEELRSRIFEPFFTTKDKHEGTGLGLAMVYGIVKQNQGGIELSSELGRGSRFTIYWPISAVTAGKPIEKTQTAADSGGNETILIVEDDPDVCRFTGETLRTLGYTVRTANNGQDALALIETDRHALAMVITDQIMPGMNGVELIAAIRKRFPDMKAILVSGYADRQVYQTGPAQPELDFLHKPYTIQALAEKVRTVLDRS